MGQKEEEIFPKDSGHCGIWQVSSWRELQEDESEVGTSLFACPSCCPTIFFPSLTSCSMGSRLSQLPSERHETITVFGLGASEKTKKNPKKTLIETNQFERVYKYCLSTKIGHIPGGCQEWSWFLQLYPCSIVPFPFS